MKYRAACGRRIDICGYRSVPTDLFVFLSVAETVSRMLF